MDLIEKVTNKFGKVPTFLYYKDLAELLGLKTQNMFAITVRYWILLKSWQKIHPEKGF